MTLHYPFPLITTIDDVLPHIDDKYFRRVTKDDGYTYINYNMMSSSVFPPVEGSPEEKLSAAVRRECRGITFDSDGKLISRPFHKFFNLGEPSSGEVSLSTNHAIYEKLDGSMLRPLPNGRWATKMGTTEIALKAEEYIAKNWFYQEFANLCMDQGQTPIFEYVGPYNRIVLDYSEGLFLLALRNNFRGTYEDIDRVTDVPTVMFDNNTLEDTRSSETTEGVVISFSDGHMVKVKSDWYVKAHRAKELLVNPRRFVEAYLNDVIDDALPTFLPEDQTCIEEKLEYLNTTIENLKYDLDLKWESTIARYDTKKDFAIASKDWTPDLNIFRQYIFKKWDQKVEDAEEYIRNVLTQSISSANKFEEKMKELKIDFT